MKANGPNYYELIARLDSVIADITAAGLRETAVLLRMAKLDLVSRANGIDERHLEVFLSALERERTEAARNGANPAPDDGRSSQRLMGPQARPVPRQRRPRSTAQRDGRVGG